VNCMVSHGVNGVDGGKQFSADSVDSV